MELKWVIYLITITWMQKAYLPLFSLPWRLEHAATDTKFVNVVFVLFWS